MSRESRSISVLEGDWDRWTRSAGERGIAERGKAYSVSELIRKAVEAYEHESTGRKQIADGVGGAGAEDHGPVRAGALGRSGGGRSLGGKSALRGEATCREGRVFDDQSGVLGARDGVLSGYPDVDTTPAGWEDVPIISPEEAKERVEALARDTAGLILPVGYTGADASELIFGPTERMTPTPPRDLALPPLAPHIAAEHERVAEVRRRQPITKESQLKRRGKR